ncbi:MAG: 3-dehydroquinate synthase [Clostridia bacterium]|nr:3-dehydroquinate synthase [Clostridia bacterium]
MNSINIIPNTTIYFKSATLLPSLIDFSSKKVVFVASPTVKTYVKAIQSKFVENNISCYTFYLNDGENNKNLENALKLTDFLCENSISRNDVLINVGGGTVCDLGAFVASVYMRGIKFINIPTTLLCACDASIGGKTAIDISGIKNFWGTFYQPFAVVIDCEFLNGLSSELVSDGLSEIVKYAIIDQNFYEKLLNFKTLKDIKSNLAEILYDCLTIKSKFVKLDEYDQNERKILNLGHTVAHAVESSSNYQINHAKAVAFGLIVESKIASELSLISNSRLDSILSLINNFLSVNIKISVNDLLPYMLKDKKNSNNMITFSLPSEIGVKVTQLSLDKTKEIMQKIL